MLIDGRAMERMVRLADFGQAVLELARGRGLMAGKPKEKQTAVTPVRRTRRSRSAVSRGASGTGPDVTTSGGADSE